MSLIDPPDRIEIRDRVRADMLTELGEAAALVPGTTEWALAQTITEQSASARRRIATIGAGLVPGPDGDEATLLKWATLFLEIPRKPAQSGTGTISFAGTGTIPAMTKITIGARVYFPLADASGTGTVNAPVVAAEPGLAGNVSAGAPATLGATLAGISTAGTVAAGGITNGVDLEPLSRVAQRLQQRLRRPPGDGSTADIERWILELPGNTRAWVYPLDPAIGQYSVAFVRDDDPTTIIPDSYAMELTRNYLQSRTSPTAGRLTVRSLVGRTLTWRVNFTPSSEAIRLSAETAVRELVRSEAEPGLVFDAGRVSDAIASAPRVVRHRMVSFSPTLAMPTEIYTDAAIVLA